jgi:hypothetical protein
MQFIAAKLVPAVKAAETSSVRLLYTIAFVCEKWLILFIIPQSFCPVNCAKLDTPEGK